MTLFAWVLVIGWGYNNAVTVSGIATQTECQRLGAELNAGYFLQPEFTCHRYQVLK